MTTIDTVIATAKEAWGDKTIIRRGAPAYVPRVSDDGATAQCIAAAAALAWNAAIDAAQDELVRQDSFTERSLRILDELRTEKADD